MPSPKSKPTPLFSLKGALKGDKQRVEQVDDVAQSVQEEDVESKLNGAKEAIMEFVLTSRPRFVTLFESMRVEANCIYLESPTEELSIELRRNETDILTKIKEIAGVRGAIVLQIDINEQIKAKRPIKLEDRIAHFTQLNPLIVEMTESLDLQIDG